MKRISLSIALVSSLIAASAFAQTAPASTATPRVDQREANQQQRIVRGQPPLSPAIARRLLSHFRPGSTGDSGPMGLNSGFGSLTSSAAPSSRGVTLDPVPEWERLTPRENEVLTYLSKGFTIKEIANLMGIKWFTVNDHIKSIYKKLNVSSRAEAAVLASKQGLV